MERKNEKLLNNDFKLSYDFDSSVISGIKSTLSLSSIEYDKYNNRIYLTTSYEAAEEKIGAYLWTLPLSDFEKNTKPSFVTNKEGKPLFFKHKVEELTAIDSNTVFLISDDDRFIGEENGGRKPKQAAYYIVKVNN